MSWFDAGKAGSGCEGPVSVAPNCRNTDHLAMPVMCGQISERCAYDTPGRPVMRAAADEVGPLQGVTLDLAQCSQDAMTEIV